MKICKIIIKGFQQFDDVTLDFTHPETGEPLNQLCFIGQNGTGKSTILQLLSDFLLNRNLEMIEEHQRTQGAAAGQLVAFKLRRKGGDVYKVYFAANVLSKEPLYISDRIDTVAPDWVERFQQYLSDFNSAPRNSTSKEVAAFFYSNQDFADCYFKGKKKQDLVDALALYGDKGDLVVFSPPEAFKNEYMRVFNAPKTSLNDALQLMNQFPVGHIVSKETASDMWKTLVYLIKKRERERELFETREENLDVSKRELIEKFNVENPDVLEALAGIWNRILDRAGLVFDIQTAQIPIQLTDNLQAYIRLKHGRQQQITYNKLSTGIRDFLFRIGHIYLLYYHREVRRGFVMVDEPENSLFPDFLFDLMEMYKEIANPEHAPQRSQLFFATHSPIVAAQFEPHERVILEWREDGYVAAHRGKTPLGDDPNDVLKKDFELKHLMGRAGQEKWAEYLMKKKRARHEKDSKVKEKLIEEALEIGRAYNFPAGNESDHV